MQTWKKATDECSLEELVSISLPRRGRDPLLTNRQLPLFGLTARSRWKRSVLEPSSEEVVPETCVTLPNLTPREEFQAYHRAEKRNHTLRNLGKNFELSFSPLRTSLYVKSAYPTAELTPELRAKQGAFAAFRTLHRAERTKKPESASCGVRRKPTVPDRKQVQVRCSTANKSVLRTVLKDRKGKTQVFKTQEEKECLSVVFQLVGSAEKAAEREKKALKYTLNAPAEISECDSLQISPAALSPKYQAASTKRESQY